MKGIDINKALETIGLKPASKRVLTTLSELGTVSAAHIAHTLNLPKSSVYDALDELVSKSLVTEFSSGTSKTFAISDNEQIARVHKQKIEELRSAQDELLTFLKQTSKAEIVAKPRIKFYAGIEGIRQAFRDMPWQKQYKEAYLMWPTSQMIDSLGIDFMYEHRRPGIELGVVVKVIEPLTDKVLNKKGPKWLRDDRENLNVKQYAPKGITWDMSYWLYGDKCLFASGGEEKIAFVIHSKEFASLQKILWQQMWNVSK